MKLGLTQHYSLQIEEGVTAASACAFPHPSMAYLNHDLFCQLAFCETPSPDELAGLFSAQSLPVDATPVAQAYSGHQFGQFNPQLGDGRAMIIGDIATLDGQTFEFGYKGTGRTAFSRGGDGKAALAPMLREVLISEAMSALGIATTRSLAVCMTGETVMRQQPQPGAVLTRLASSHVRVGTFQYFAAREQYDVVEKLVDFCIERHYPGCAQSSNRTLSLLNAVIEAQANLISQWMLHGFIHGVMNTDNMLICAETIDYGPCAFIDSYHPAAVFSSIDHQGRYAYQNQPGIAQWNLARFAETLLPLLSDDNEQAISLATEAVKQFSGHYQRAYTRHLSQKMWLSHCDTSQSDAVQTQWLALLESQQVDFTLAHWFLINDSDALRSLFHDPAPFEQWFNEYRSLAPSPTDKATPCVIPRNHLVEQALKRAESEDMSYFDTLLHALRHPYSWPDDASLTQPADGQFNQHFVTYCGT